MAEICRKHGVKILAYGVLVRHTYVRVLLTDTYRSTVRGFPVRTMVGTRTT